MISKFVLSTWHTYISMELKKHMRYWFRLANFEFHFIIPRVIKVSSVFKVHKYKFSAGVKTKTRYIYISNFRLVSRVINDKRFANKTSDGINYLGILKFKSISKFTGDLRVGFIEQHVKKTIIRKLINICFQMNISWKPLASRISRILIVKYFRIFFNIKTIDVQHKFAKLTDIVPKICKINLVLKFVQNLWSFFVLFDYMKPFLSHQNGARLCRNYLTTRKFKIK